MSTPDLPLPHRVLRKRTRPERIRVLPAHFWRQYRLARRYAGPGTAWKVAWHMTTLLAQQEPGEPPGFWRYLPITGAVWNWGQFYVTAWKTEGYFGKLLVVLLLAASVTLLATLGWFCFVTL
jgi:hypothetical protein